MSIELGEEAIPQIMKTSIVVQNKSTTMEVFPVQVLAYTFSSLTYKVASFDNRLRMALIIDNYLHKPLQGMIASQFDSNVLYDIFDLLWGEQLLN